MLISCAKEEKVGPVKSGKTAVLLVSHGSHSETWRKMLLSLEDSVKNVILENKGISDVRSAFMEYNEPSIASRLKELDKEGYSDVILVPILLTVSTHSFDDIPHIVGLKQSPDEIEKLKAEKIEVYQAKAKVHITPLLDFPDILGKNISERVARLSTTPKNEACVLVAYGDASYNDEWTKMMLDIKAKLTADHGIDVIDYAWCGHLVGYSQEPTVDAIKRVLSKKDRALVLPVLVAYDEYFQTEIIGGAVDKMNKKGNVAYKPDAILPDANVQKWIVDISNETFNKFIKK